ncbi:hypothetical protein P9112_001727 [Eukaryota sp. TZLM1-RC]
MSLSDLQARTKANAFRVGLDDVPDVELDVQHLVTPMAGVHPISPVSPQHGTSYVFAREGVDAMATSRNIDSLDIAAPPPEPFYPMDVSQFLRQRNQSIILSAIDDCKDMLHESYALLTDNIISEDWKARQTTILDSLGATTPTPSVHAMPRHPSRHPSRQQVTRQQVSQPGSRAVAKAASDRESLLGEALETTLKHHHSSESSKLTSLLSNFHNATSSQRNNPLELQLYRAWDLVCYLLKNIKEGVVTDQNRYFRIQSIKYLAKQYKEHRPRSGETFWEGVYYYLRTNDQSKVIELIQTQMERNRHDLTLQSAGELIVNCLSENGMYDVTSTMAGNLHDQLLKISTSKVDPHLQVILTCLSGRDPRSTSKIVMSSVEDFMWFKLMVAEREPHSNYGINDLQNLLLKYGPQHFNARGENSVLYFNLLILSQNFTKACQYLFSMENTLTDAVYFSVLFCHLNLIQMTFEDDSVLLSDSEGLDLSKLIWNYYYPIAHTSPRYLINLSFLLPRSISVELLSKLITFVSTEALDLMTRKLSRDLIDDVFNEVTVLSRDLDDVDMVKILEITGKYDIIVVNLIDRLCSFFSRFADTLLPQELQNRDVLIDLSIDFYRKHQSNLIGVSGKDMNTYTFLMEIGLFYKNLEYNRVDDAFSSIAKLSVFPFRNTTVDSSISFFRGLSAQVKRIIPPLLLETVKLLGKREEEYRNEIKDLVSYASKLPFDLPVEVSSRLARLEA